jgi:hypothetical protein
MNSINHLLIAFLCVTGFASCDKESHSQNTITVTPDAPFTDYDGNTYKTVKIGNQIWMAENFKSQKAANGQIIPDVYVYENIATYATDYGRLYTYNTAANVISEVSPIDKTSGIAFAVRFIKN